MLRNVWLEFAFFKPAQQFGVRIAQELRLARLVRAPIEADHVNVLHQQNVGWGLRNASGSEANNNDATAPRDAAQARVKGIAADGIIDDIRAASARDAP